MLRRPAVVLGQLALQAPLVTAQVWDFRAPVLALGAVRRSVRGLAVSLDAAATLAAGAAAELNESLETDVFAAGMPFGTVAVRGRLRG